jgi:hypothetical protein
MHMKKNEPKTKATGDMLPEYDLAGMKGVRGKYYRAYRRGHSVRIQRADGAMSVQYFTLQDGAVMLEPDVRRHFPNSASVNEALRSLIAAPRSKQSRHKPVTKER